VSSIQLVKRPNEAHANSLPIRDLAAVVPLLHSRYDKIEVVDFWVKVGWDHLEKKNEENEV
jgi:hypothetical protein